MATINDVYAVLGVRGFEHIGSFSLGSWNNYAVLVRQATGRNLIATFAVRLPKVMFDGRKDLIRALKEKGDKAVKLAGITKNAISFTVNFGKADNLPNFITGMLDLLTGELRACGVNPADTCAMTGAARPDSLCLMSLENVPSYQPVCGAVLRDKDAKTREKVEENQVNGSYALGLIGALLGMLVGLIPNLLTIIAANSVWSLLFALVPICAMFGYKLFKGKMSKASIGIVIAVSLLGVYLIPLLEMTYYIAHDYGAQLGDALSYAAQAMTDSSFLSEISGELLQMLLFMALGIWVAWRYMSSQTNTSQSYDSEVQLSTLRPNPLYAPTESGTQD